MRRLLKLAYKLLVNDRAKYAALLVGITFAVFLMIEMTSLFAGILNRSSATVINIGASIWVLGADVTAPVFEGGTLWFKRRAAIAGYQQASDLYRQTVLGAFAQVADTLHALEHDAQFLAAEEEALSTAREALELLQANYQAGLATYLDLLNADAQFHQAQIAELEAVAMRYQDTVALFAALGGGWWNTAARSGVAVNAE